MHGTGKTEEKITDSLKDNRGRQWTACCACNRGGRGNDKDLCCCGFESVSYDGKGCFLGSPIIGEPRKIKKVSRGKARYRRYLENRDFFESFLDFLRYDDEQRREQMLEAL